MAKDDSSSHVEDKTLTIRQLKTNLKDHHDAVFKDHLTPKEGEGFLVRGAPGVGKSQMGRDYAETIDAVLNLRKSLETVDETGQRKDQSGGIPLKRIPFDGPILEGDPDQLYKEKMMNNEQKNHPFSVLQGKDKLVLESVWKEKTIGGVHSGWKGAGVNPDTVNLYKAFKIYESVQRRPDEYPPRIEREHLKRLMSSPFHSDIIQDFESLSELNRAILELEANVDVNGKLKWAAECVVSHIDDSPKGKQILQYVKENFVKWLGDGIVSAKMCELIAPSEEALTVLNQARELHSGIMGIPGKMESDLAKMCTTVQNVLSGVNDQQFERSMIFKQCKSIVKSLGEDNLSVEAKTSLNGPS